MMKLLLFLLLLLLAADAAPCYENQQCTLCAVDGRCTSKCFSGYYGLKCNLKCSQGCRNNICTLNTKGDDECTDGCKLGFYGAGGTIPCKTQVYQCRKCPQKCEGGYCQLESSCTQGCQDSYYGTACRSCPAGCKVCNRVSGSCEVCLQCEGNCTQGCLGECKQGYFGNFCEHSCSLNCMSGCDQTSGDCFKCISGWFGASCEKQCPNRCADEKCDMDGICTFGCTLGWFGLRCNNECHPSCVDHRCDRNGACSDGCKLGFHGEHCQKKCPAFCFNKLCDFEDGSCQTCKKGFYGSHCNKSCVRCIDSACSQDTGHCIQGCLSNYRGEFCQHDCTGNCDEEQCRDVCKTIPGMNNDSAFNKHHGGEFCQHDCKQNCTAYQCSDVCKSVYEESVSSRSRSAVFPSYLITGVFLIFIIFLVVFVYVTFHFKRLQSVIYGYRKGGQGHQLQPRRNSAEVREPPVNFYCEIDDPSESPQLPSRCGTAFSASPHTSSQNRHEGISSISYTMTPDNSKQKDDGTVQSGEGASSNPESASPSQAEEDVEDTAHSEKQADDVSIDLVPHAPARPNSYLTPFVPYIANKNVAAEVGQISVPIVQGKALGSNTRPPEIVDIKHFTRSKESCLSVPFIASGFDAGYNHATTETQNAHVAVTNVPVNAQGVDEVPLLYINKTELQHRSSPDSTEYAKAQGFCTDITQITTESSEDAEAEEKLSNISVPVIADCYDNFSVDDEEEGIPNPPPDNYTKLFASIANINVEKVGQITVPIVQGTARGSNTRPPEMVDIESFTRSQECYLSVPNIYAKASGFDAGPSNATSGTKNDCDAVTNVPVNAQGVDEVPLLNYDKTQPQHRSSPDSTKYAKAQEFCTHITQITTESSEDAEADEKLSNISVPVIADCYDNFSVDDEEEGIPNPPPDNYTKLFYINHVRK